jgi:beta-mannosidase
MVSKEIHENWTFRKKGDDQWLPAIVPGCVHTDLLENKIIPDPFTGLNEKEVQWIEKEDWEYRCKFDVSSYLLDHDQLEIWFYGVDTYAEISLNGKIILQTNNMFHPWCADVKKLLHEGENALFVRFASPYAKGLEKYNKLPYQLPAINDKGEFRVSPYSRKAAYQYGWDWAPRLLTSGLWKNVELLAWNKLKIRDFFILQKDQRADLASLSCELELDIHSAGEYIFAVYVDKDLVSTGKYRLTEGINKFCLPIQIYNPKLWYPRGYGNPDVYKITVDIKDNDIIIDTRQTTTGLRKVELISKESGSNGDFHFRVNGVDVFARGANIVPMDYFLPRIKIKDYKTLINNAVSVNMNMLRVWGGAVYENDSFYNLCNQEGIMIWQDFMFACMMYPSDNEFLASVKEELDYNIKRLRNHPSVVLWCGNNEILEGYHSWGWKEQLGENAEKAFESYKRLFYEVIPETLSVLDASRPYIPSSPSSSFSGSPDINSGDFHFWDIIKQPLPLSSYAENVGRFMSEYGFKSYPDLKTIFRYARENDLDIHSAVLESHQGWESGAELVERHVTSLYGIPDSFENFLFLSQLTQKEAIKIAIEAHRRAKPWCMGSLFWQLNDCWPCASWSAIDYYGRWKALMYELKHLFADTIISPVIKNNQLDVFVISDKLNPVKMKASIKVMNFDGFEIFNKELDFKPKGSSSELIFSLSIDKLNIANLKNQVVLVTEIYDEKKRLDRNLLYFVRPADLLLKPASPKLEFNETGNRTMIFLSSPVLVKNVFLENHDMDGFFSDNFFDLLPGENKPVIFQSVSTIPSESRFTVKSLNKLLASPCPSKEVD